MLPRLPQPQMSHAFVLCVELPGGGQWTTVTDEYGRILNAVAPVPYIERIVVHEWELTEAINPDLSPFSRMPEWRKKGEYPWKI